MNKIVITSLLIVFASLAQASNIGFLGDSVLSELSEDELVDFRQFIGVSLDTLEDARVVQWQSASGSMTGQFKVKFTFQSDDATCRRSLLRVVNGKQKKTFQFDICQSGGRWEIQRTPVRNFKNSDWKMLRASLFSALDQPLIGAPFAWHNERTGNRGSHVVVAEKNSADQRCRQVAITVFDKGGKSSNGVYVYCKPISGDAASEWKRSPSMQEF